MIRIFLLSLAAILPASAALSDDFYQLIRANDSAGLKALLKKGANVNEQDSRGATPLMYAAVTGSPEVMKLLLDAGADVKMKNAFGATALLWSAGDLRKVRMLIDKGADVNAATKQGVTPLLSAASHDGAGEVVRLLLTKGADIKAKDGHGNTALHSAARSNDTAVIRLMIEKGLDPNAKSQDGSTALLASAMLGNLPATKLLLAKGAGVNASWTDAGTVKNGPIALTKLTPLSLAAAYGPANVVQALIDARSDVNARDVRGMTPLMLAASSETQDAAVVRQLLEKGADPSIKSLAGETAADWARKFGNPAVLGLLGTTAAGPAGSAATRPTPANQRTAAQKSVALLQRSSSEFFVQSGCVGCHHQNLTALAVRSARDKGLSVDENAAAEQLKATKFQWVAFQELLLQRIDPPGGIDMTVYSLLAMDAANYPPDQVTDAMVFHVAATQRQDGSWHDGGIARAPMEDGDIFRTALSLLSLQRYGSPGRQAEFDRRIKLARNWLLAAKPRVTEDRNMQIVGLNCAGASRDVIAGLAKTLLAEQRPDGGWAQNKNLPSDAYATGQALATLIHSASLPERDPAVERGVRYLLTTQLEDGSWHVRSRAPKFQPYFQSGFPHDHDQWISAAATAWASIALTLAIEK